MINPLLAISTYKKNEALRAILKSIETYMPAEHVLVTDDNEGEALPVLEEFPTLNLNYMTGPNVGVAKNKNRAIYYMREYTDHDSILLIDDDIEFTSSKLIEEFNAAYEVDKEEHINTYIGGPEAPFNRLGIFHDFPIISQTEYLYKCKGSYGICSFYTRNLLDRIGYFQKFPYIYGFEHSEHSARALKVQGKFPELFPMLKRSYKLLKTQEIPNNYEVDQEIVHSKQYRVYIDYLQKIYRGVDLNNKQHFLDLSKETIK